MDELLEMAQELDGMDRSVTSWEADFLESVLVRLREGRGLTTHAGGQEAKLRQIYAKYFEGGDDAPPPPVNPDFNPEDF